jgi:uncharacterized protein with PQ loop repeat
MLVAKALLEFSHHYCVEICTFLVPAILLATLNTLICLSQDRPIARTQNSALLGVSLALIMVLHVLSWLVVGIVMAPTFILLALGGACLSINISSVAHPVRLRQLLVGMVAILRETCFRSASPTLRFGNLAPIGNGLSGVPSPSRKMKPTT